MNKPFTSSSDHGPLYYMASPIKSHKNDSMDAIQEITERAFNCVKALGQLMQHGWLVYSPHVHHYGVCHFFDMPSGWDFWSSPSFAMLDRCDAMMILELEGWDKSEGIKAELRRAFDQKKPVLHVPYPLEWDGDKLKVNCYSITTKEQLEQLLLKITT